MHSTKILAAGALALGLIGTQAWADEPDGLKLPKGFHATVVVDNIPNARHIAVRSNGDLYISTRPARGKPSTGIVALHLNPDGQVVSMQNFGKVDGGTGIRFYKGSLYAASVTGIYKFDFKGDDVLPAGDPTVVVDGMPAAGGQANRPIAIDDKGNLYVALGGSGNICVDPKAPKVGLDPCPGLQGRGGIWEFSAAKSDQKFPADGQQLATGLRDMDALDYRKGDALYGAMHDRNVTSATWPDLVSAEDEKNIADELHRVVKGVNMGWPTTYYDGARKIRLVAPEYGGDGKKTAKDGEFTTPVYPFAGHSAPLDMVFYTGKSFPKAYQGGAFVALHGSGAPYNVLFLPFDGKGKVGAPEVFADGFTVAGGANAYKPVGLALAPDGSLYVADSQKGKIWKITYTGK